MNRMPKDIGPTAFRGLTPERILRLVEEALDIRCTNLCRPYNSYINRVCEVEDSDRNGLVVKFYRPGRWTREAIRAEHDFLFELAAEEIPVIAPLMLADGSSLGESEGLCFAVFPRIGGRSVDEINDEQWLSVGRLLGRMHMVGARKNTTARLQLHPQITTRAHLQFIAQSRLIPADLLATYTKVCTSLIDTISPLFNTANSIRIHGDCHKGNILYQPGKSFLLIDFDDMLMGPSVQDIWMLLPGDLNDSLYEIELLVEGYETFHPFNMASLAVIEPLRAMRFIHYSAWCAYQVAEDGKTEIIPDFGSRQYWQAEIQDLQDQMDRIADGKRSVGNML